MKRVLLSWSSGKDAAWTLHVLRAMPDVEVVGLLTTVNRVHDRVAMHAVRRTLLRRQAEAVGSGLHEAELPWPCSNDEYERIMAPICARAADDGVTHVAFGDLFLEDVRAYREARLRGTGLEPLFPLWGRDTGELVREMIDGGLRAVVTCVGASRRGGSLRRAGRVPHVRLRRPDVPPPARGRGSERVERDGFWFADVVSRQRDG
jgi:diphthamide synthase (EF-2-diphthine--ammonia ligase)